MCKKKTREAKDNRKRSVAGKAKVNKKEFLKYIRNKRNPSNCIDSWVLHWQYPSSRDKCRVIERPHRSSVLRRDVNEGGR